jgi:hypothetical protein
VLPKKKKKKERERERDMHILSFPRRICKISSLQSGRTSPESNYGTILISLLLFETI